MKHLSYKQAAQPELISKLNQSSSKTIVINNLATKCDLNLSKEFSKVNLD